jgi:hypothetical protein
MCIDIIFVSHKLPFIREGIRIHDLKMLDVSLRPRVGVSIKDHMDR